jgi:hypothetical protein
MNREPRLLAGRCLVYDNKVIADIIKVIGIHP